MKICINVNVLKIPTAVIKDDRVIVENELFSRIEKDFLDEIINKIHEKDFFDNSIHIKKFNIEEEDYYVVQIIEQQSKEVRDLEKIARTDMLTGLHNRLHFNEYLKNLLKKLKNLTKN